MNTILKIICCDQTMLLFCQKYIKPRQTGAILCCCCCCCRRCCCTHDCKNIKKNSKLNETHKKVPFFAQSLVC